MNSTDIDLVQRSFVKVMHNRASAGRLFYERLFAIALELKPMFKTDITSQSTKLIDTLGLSIGQLRHEQFLSSTLRSLGERHAAYGVEAKHYEQVGQALIATLETVLAEAFTPEVRVAWSALYTKAAATMKAAAYEAAA